MKKAALVGGGILLVLLVALAVGLRLFVDPGRLRPELESRMGAAIGRKVTIGNLRIAWLSLGVAVDNLTIADDPAFSTKPFVIAKSVKVGVDLMPLITSRTLRVQSFQLDEPQVNLVRAASGDWNFSRLGAADQASSTSQSTSSDAAATAASILVQKISIVNGRVVLAGPGLGGKERVYDHVGMEVTDVSLTSRLPFTLSATTPGGGSVRLSGHAGPVNLANVAFTPLDASADVTHFDVATSGLVDPAAGVAGQIDFTGKVSSSNGEIRSTGTMTVTNVQLLTGAGAAHVPIQIDYESSYVSKTQIGTVTKGDVHIGKALARLTGDFNLAGASPSVRMALVGTAMSARELEAALPAVGFTLPSGASLQQGTLNTQLNIAGPIDRLTITGPIALTGATLAGYDLAGKMGALAAFAGLPKGRDTEIQRLAAAVHAAPEGIHVDDIALIAPAIGSLSGRGSIAPGGALDFAMVAKLTGVQGVAGGLARMASLGNTEDGVPFKIQGTTSNPSFIPDVKAMTGNVVKGAATAKAASVLGGSKAGTALGGLLGRKK